MLNRNRIDRAILTKEVDMRAALLWLSTCLLISTDVETIPHMPKSKKKQPFVMTVVSYTGLGQDGVIASFAVQLTQQKSAIMDPPTHFGAAMRFIRDANALDIEKVLHNGVYDCAWFCRYRVPLSNYAWDTMTMWWSRYPDLPKTLDVVSSVVLDSHTFWKMGRKEEDFTAHTLYAMEDTETTLLCCLGMMPWLLADRATMLNYNDAHQRCLIGLEMSLKGAPVDQDRRSQMGEALEAESEKTLTRLRYLVADEEFNPNSPKQMSHLLYGLLGAAKRNAKGRELKRITGNAKVSTGAMAMRAMKSDHPLIGIIVDAVTTAKVPAKQISNVMSIQMPDNRFRTSYDGIGTTTTRYSSRRDAFGFGGNAQNIRKKYRAMMGPDPDSFYLEVDFSAADDVFVSYESEESKKIDLVITGQDAHSFNASHIFFTNWTYDQIVAGKKAGDPLVVHPITGIRQITKKTTHGANYLMAGMTLLMSAGREAIVSAAKHAGHSDAGVWNTARLAEFCEYLDERYRNFYPRFQRHGSGSFYAELQIGLNKTGAYNSIFGYSQRFSAPPEDQGTLRACAASVGQANTAGRVNMALRELVMGERTLRFRDGPAPDAHEPPLRVNEDDFGCSIRFQTHDSVTYMVRHTHPHWQVGVDRILKVMKRPVLCKGRIVNVGIEADVAWSWADNSHEIRDSSGIESWLADAIAVKGQTVSLQ